MNWFQLKPLTWLKLIPLFVFPIVLTAAGCDATAGEILKGVLQSVDSVEGEVTIVTKDGKTVTLDLGTEAQVETDEAGSTLPSTLPPSVEVLEPGASVEVEVNEGGQVVQRIKAKQRKVEGTVVEIVDNEVTIETERGRRVTLAVTDRTRIRLEDHLTGTLEDLRVGQPVKVKFGTESRVAFKIDTREEEAKIEGVVVRVNGDEVTVETERGRRLILVVHIGTRIELDDDFPGTPADLREGLPIEAKFDPYTRRVFKIEVEKAEIEGIIVEIVSNEITVEMERGIRRTVSVDNRTRVEVDDDFPGALTDLQVGERVEVRFDPVTSRAFKVEVQEADEEEREEVEIEGAIVGIEGGRVTIETESGRIVTLPVTDRTYIELEDDLLGAASDLQEGAEVEVKFYPNTDDALKIELGD